MTYHFLKAQEEALERYSRKRNSRSTFGNEEDENRDQEDTALAAAIAASAEDEDERISQQRREYDRIQCEKEEEARRRQKEKEIREQEKFAKKLQEDELSKADHELASAIDASSAEAEARSNHKRLDRTLEEAKHQRQMERHSGCWDCSICTYENEPFEPSCGACGNKIPPPGTLVFQPLPLIPSEASTFGVELELFVSDGKHDGYTHEWVAKELTKLGPPSITFCGYTHETRNDWKLVTDASLKGYHHSRDLCMELVSPVLKGNEGLKELRALMEHVRQLGIATNRTCGFHVHVDATTITLDELKRTCQCFVALENAFDLLVAKGNSTRQRINRTTNENKYCQSNRMLFGSLSNRQRWFKLQQANSIQTIVELINPNNDRYRKLNLTNLLKESRPSTLEFRLHGGVEELREAEAWIRLLLRFCNKARKNRSADDEKAFSNIQTLADNATPAQELRLLWQLIDCSGLQQFYTLDRKLFEPRPGANVGGNNLQNMWRCKGCRKPFKTSRALSQHLEATGQKN